MALTNEQKESVISLRETGLGYLRIANQLGVKKSQVRDYCRTKQFKSKVVNEVILPANVRKIISCKQCNKDYYQKETKLKSLVYCSLECKEQRVKDKKAETIKKRTKICATCGREHMRVGGAIYCSLECSKEKFVCEVCGIVFMNKIGSKAKHCSNKCSGIASRSTHEEYYNKFSSIHKGNIVPTSKYKGGNLTISVWCVDCQKETTKQAKYFIGKGNSSPGCSHCSRVISRGEERIERWLVANRFNYESQCTFKDLEHKGKLRYDFAIKDKENRIVKLIEYNGRQHYEPVSNFGGVIEFDKQLIRDCVKKDYADDKGIELLTISHINKNELENILESELKTESGMAAFSSGR